MFWKKIKGYILGHSKLGPNALKSLVLSYNNTTFQLFGADVAPNQYLDAQLIELNKGPDMGAKDKRDKDVKMKVQEDLFDLLGVINSNKKNEFKLIWNNKT